MDSAMRRALAQGRRVEILETIAAAPTSPWEIATASGDSLDKVSYHASVLRETGCIRPVEPIRHDSSHQVYEIASLSHFAPPLPLAPSTRSLAIATILQRIVEKGTAALEAGTLGSRDRVLVSCESLLLDEQGQREAKAILDEAARRIEAAKSATARRLAKSGEQGIKATVALAAFESPR